MKPRSFYLNIIIAIVAMSLFACNTISLSEANSPAEETQPVTEDVVVSTKKILWIDSYHQGYEGSYEASIRETLEGDDVELEIIHMDTKRNPGDEFGEEAAKTVMAKLEAFQPDVVIASDDNAQKYVVVPYLKDTELPIVFAGVNWDSSGYGYPADNITGIEEVMHTSQAIEHIKPYAQGERIGYLAGNTTTAKTVADVYFSDDQIKKYYATTFDEFKAFFLAAQEEVDILFIFNFAGIEDWDNEEAEIFIMENITIPTAATLERMTPYTLLTLAQDLTEQGEWSAKTALEILEGTDPSDISITQNVRGKLFLNFDMANKLDVKFASELLKNVEVIETQ